MTTLVRHRGAVTCLSLGDDKIFAGRDDGDVKIQSFSSLGLLFFWLLFLICLLVFLIALRYLIFFLHRLRHLGFHYILRRPRGMPRSSTHLAIPPSLSYILCDTDKSLHHCDIISSDVPPHVLFP
jgi:hypothetical protein